MGRKTRNHDRELSENQKLKAENKTLKRQLSKLRKQLNRIDLEAHDNLRGLVKKQRREDLELQKKGTKDKKEHNKWLCRKCNEDHLRIFIIDRRDGPHYFRRCITCGNRTKIQKYNENVEEGPK